MSFALGGWSGETRDGDRSKWKPVAATGKFAFETKRLADEPREEDVEERNSLVDRTDGEVEDSDSEEVVMVGGPDTWYNTPQPI